jgi:hypothetical protein
MPLCAKVINPAFSGHSRVWMDVKLVAFLMLTGYETPKDLAGDDPDDVLFNSVVATGRSRTKLNSLNGSMARKIIPGTWIFFFPI